MTKESTPAGAGNASIGVAGGGGVALGVEVRVTSTYHLRWEMTWSNTKTR